MREQIDSPFQLTEHLKALYHDCTHPPNLEVTQPITRATASRLAAVPQGVDRSLWLYELCRFLVQKINTIITSLFADNPPCSAATCPEMRASEWQYLCAVHDPPKSCCAIDYCCHTLDWAANTLTSPQHFPSRLTLGTAQDMSGAGPGSSRGHQERQLTNVFRRVYRILAHAWFQHRDVFWRVENRTGLYVFFKTVCDAYALIPEDNYTIPAAAEGLEDENDDLLRSHMGPTDQERGREAGMPAPGGILKRDAENNVETKDDQGRISSSEGATAKRHRHAPSRGGSTVTTVIEENEEDEGQKQQTESIFPSLSSTESGNQHRQIDDSEKIPTTATTTNGLGDVMDHDSFPDSSENPRNLETSTSQVIEEHRPDVKDDTSKIEIAAVTTDESGLKDDSDTTKEPESSVGDVGEAVNTTQT